MLSIIKRMGVFRPSDLEARGIGRNELYRLVRQGLVVRQARGVYVANSHPLTAEHALAQVAKRVPNAVFCLLTALRFHELTTQSPHEVWMAIGRKAWRPDPSSLDWSTVEMEFWPDYTDSAVRLLETLELPPWLEALVIPLVKVLPAGDPPWFPDSQRRLRGRRCLGPSSASATTVPRRYYQ